MERIVDLRFADTYRLCSAAGHSVSIGRSRSSHVIVHQPRCGDGMDWSCRHHSDRPRRFPSLPFTIMSCYRPEMLKSRIKRRTIEGTQAVLRLAEIEASVAALKDEDLLDLADIFAREGLAPLKEMAAAEMTKRNLSL